MTDVSLREHFEALLSEKDKVTRRLDKNEGAGVGRNALWVILSGVAGIAIGVLGFVLK